MAPCSPWSTCGRGGFAYEKGVNELVIQQDEDYITQIEIPVQDPCSDGSSPRSHRTT